MSVANAPSTARTGGPVLGLTRVFNRFVLPLAGTRAMPLYGVLEHRGRRSGKTFRTPVVVRPTAEGFIVPMPWGEQTDWCRNVRAAGECVVRWKGRDYPLVQPEVIDSTTAAAAFGSFQGSMMLRFGIDKCMRLRHRQAPQGV